MKNDDLNLLKGEIIFTVNQAYRNISLRMLSPIYHLWVDKNFFEINENRPEDLELLECMRQSALSSEEICCFYPIEQYDFIKKYGLFIENRTFFLNPLFHIDGYRHFNSDISGITYSMGTVVQNAIIVSIYMGFKEIFLLGCDSTGIVNTLNASMRVDNNEYGYIVTDNEKHRMEKMVAKSRIIDYAYSYYMTLKGFEYLYQACLYNNISLINCSSTTVLDMIPRMTLAQVIKKENNEYV